MPTGWDLIPLSRHRMEDDAMADVAKKWWTENWVTIQLI